MAKLEIGRIGELIKASGFKVDKEALKTTIGTLEELESFISLKTKGLPAAEDQVRSLQRDGILSEEQAKAALAAAKKHRKVEGGIKYEVSDVETAIGEVKVEDESKKQTKIRRVITVARNNCRNTLRLLRELE